LAAGKWQILKAIDSVAVDRVRSEPLSGKFPLTGNKTEKFGAFVSKPSQEKSYISLDILDLPQSDSIWAHLDRS
jgi:hypothetical protein